jgi:hypothetical protein
MHGHRTIVVLVLSVALISAACTDEPGDASGGPAVSGAPPTESADTVSPPVDVTSAKDFDPSHFGSSTVVDNTWFPLSPGTRWTWKGHAFDEGDRIRRQVIATVTDMTKEIDGVRTVVVLENDYNDGDLAESELAFFAQDDAGNVWHLGEYPEEYEEGEIVKTPAWIHGILGSRAGLHLKVAPAVGTPSYAQGWGPQVGWDDRAKVFRTGEDTCTPLDCYGNVLVMREFSRSEPGASQLKYFAPEVGNVRVGWMGPNEEEREVLALVSREELGPDELAEVRADALAHERRAYRLNRRVYGQTSPMEPRAG